MLTVHIETVNLSPHGEQDIIVSASGSQGFVSIDGKRTYLNLFDSSTPDAHLAPTRVHTLPMSGKFAKSNITLSLQVVVTQYAEVG